MKRIRLKKKKISIKKYFIMGCIIALFISVFYFINLLNDKLTPIFMENAEIELNKISTIIVNNAISSTFKDEISSLELFDVIKNSNGEIQTIDFDPVMVNKILGIVTDEVQEDLAFLKNGEIDNIDLNNEFSIEKINDLKDGIIVRVPIGSFTNNTLISNLGPKIPIKLSYIGDVNSNIVTKITQYGINNAMVEVGIKVDVIAQIVLPFTIKKTTFSYEMPLIIKMIQGIVPDYYGGDLIRNSAIISSSRND